MIYPQPGRVLIKKLDREVKANGGILMPGSAIQEEGLFYGEIIRLATQGDELELHGFRFKVGMKVFYSKYSAAMVSDDKGKTMYLVSDLDIMAHEEDDDTSTL